MDKIDAYRAGFAQGYFEKSAGAILPITLMGLGGGLAGVQAARYSKWSPTAQLWSGLAGGASSALLGVLLAQVAKRQAGLERDRLKNQGKIMEAITGEAY